MTDTHRRYKLPLLISKTNTNIPTGSFADYDIQHLTDNLPPPCGPHLVHNSLGSSLASADGPVISITLTIVTPFFVPFILLVARLVRVVSGCSAVGAAILVLGSGIEIDGICHFLARSAVPTPERYRYYRRVG